MQKFSTLIISLGLAFCSQAQDIKLLDYAPQYAKQKVSERKSSEIKLYKGIMDTTVCGVAKFNAQGKVVHYTEYFARGRKMAEYSYEYDANGKLVAGTVQTTFNDWQPLAFQLNFDTKGRLISRELPESISNFWKKETFHYTNTGVLIKNEKWHDLNGTLSLMETKDYPQTLTTTENSLTYIYNPQGLLMIHQLYNSNGKVERSMHYDYVSH